MEVNFGMQDISLVCRKNIHNTQKVHCKKKNKKTTNFVGYMYVYKLKIWKTEVQGVISETVVKMSCLDKIALHFVLFSTT